MKLEEQDTFRFNAAGELAMKGFFNPIISYKVQPKLHMSVCRKGRSKAYCDFSK